MPLPDLLYLNDYGGDWKAYLEAIYSVYTIDILQGRPMFRGTRVSSRRVPESGGKGAGFWHVISEGRTEADRLINLRRCERIRWIRYAIDNADADPDIGVWENQRGNETNILLWTREEYLVILGRRADYYLLRSAYVTDKQHNIVTLRRERDAWQNSP